ncbi:helix-turn-helix domain-containing protein [Kitasatospora sp. McL0602]|uniref:helix-turn-helix domain-containing protein n=1 Tax=Kitasatospora sp. McL0602 TaxID=3439530 RepID=UPI003F8B036D
MTSLYERMASSPSGARMLAGARLKHEALRSLHQALLASGMSQSELAEKLGVGKSAVNQTLRGDGNVRIKTLAEYLHAMGFELDLTIVDAGEPRKALVEGREASPALPSAPSPETVSPAPDNSREVVQVIKAGETRSLLVEVMMHSINDAQSSFHFEGQVHVVDLSNPTPGLTRSPKSFQPLGTPKVVA